MTRVRLINASTWLAFAAGGLYLVGTATPLAAQQKGSTARPPTLSRRARSAKPTWHSGPATTPPQTEVVLPPREAPPPAKSTLLQAQADGNKPDVTKPSAVTTAGWDFLTGHPSVAGHEPTPTPNAMQREDSNAPELAAQRVRDELSRLRNDAGARRAFYDELRRTVEEVRSGRRDENSQNPAPTLPKLKSGRMGEENWSGDGPSADGSPYNR